MALLDNVWYVDDPQYAVVPLGTTSGVGGATLTLSNITVPSGALIVACVSENSAVAGSLADGGTNTYGNASNSPISYNAAASRIYIFFVANAGALSGATLTYTKGTSGVATSMSAFYVPGIATASAEDTAVAASATGNSASASVTSNAPTQNADLLVGVVGVISGSTTPAAATGWNQTGTVGLANATLGVFVGGVRGGLAPATLTSAVTSSQWGAGIVAFKYASAPGGYSGVNGWKASTTQVAGDLIRQSDLSKVAIGSERVFVCYNSTGGTGQTAASEPTITATRGALTTDNTVKWQEATGVAALNGDLTNTPTWTTYRAAGAAATLGQVIQSTDGTKVLICTVAGTMSGVGSEPTWSAYTTTGATTTDNGATWVTLAAVPSGFSNWAAPHARLANAFAANWGAAGNSFFVASEHAEMQAAFITLTSPGTAASPCFVYCVNKSNVPPGSANISTGAIISTIGANNINFGSQSIYWTASATPGISFQVGSLASTANIAFSIGSSTYNFFKNCQFVLNNTGTSRFLSNSGSSSGIKLICHSCNFTFGNSTSQAFSSSAAADVLAYFLNCSVSVGTTIPSVMMLAGPPLVLFEACDLSAFGSGTTLIGASGLSGITTIKDCKLGASVVIASAPSTTQQRTDLIRSDDSGTNYRHESYQYPGTQMVETTIVRTGGASDGTTPLSWKVVATANSKWVLPFECIPITQWVDTTGSHTVTVYGTTTGGGVPNNDDIWVTAEYLENAGNPQGGFATTTKSDNLAASTTTNNSADGSTWGGGGAGNGFKMVTPSFTVNQKGLITVYVYVAKAGATYYVDPKVTVS